MLGKAVEDRAVAEAEAVSSLGRDVEGNLEVEVAHSLGANVVDDADNLAPRVEDWDNLASTAVVMALCWEVVGTLEVAVHSQALEAEEDIPALFVVDGVLVV